MKTISIKKLALTLIVGLGSVMTIPAYAWPDTDEMNMCGAAVKTVRAYNGHDRGWAAHDNYIANRDKNYYYRTNCPESTATKNYKGKYWMPEAEMHVEKKVQKEHVKHHGHKKTLDCIRTDRLNSAGLVVKKGSHDTHVAHDDFHRQAQAVLNMGKAKKVKMISKKTNNDYCAVTNGLNTNGAVVKVVHIKHH